MENNKVVIRSKDSGSIKSLLKKGMIPGILYGKGTESTKIAFENKVCAISPAIGGSRQTLNTLIRVNFQPRIAISNGSRASDQAPHPVRYATATPILLPERKSPARSGIVTTGPPGVSVPAADAIKIPRNPDSGPSHFEINSCC